MQINDILAMTEEQEIRKLNIPNAVIIWSGPYTFTEAAARSGGGLYVITKKSGKPLYVGQTGSYRSRFSSRLHVLRIAACDLTQRGIYLGRIVKPASRFVTKNLRLDLESVLIRSYLRRKHHLVNRNSIRTFKMGPSDATIHNDGTVPPQMERRIRIKGNSEFELKLLDDSDELRGYHGDELANFEIVDLEAEISRRRRIRRKKSSDRPAPARLRFPAGRSRLRRIHSKPRRRPPLFRRSRALLSADVQYPGSSEAAEFICWIQSSLNRILGIRLSVNGVMNNATRDALRSFQRRKRLPVDGIVGPETKQALIVGRSR